jgi:hypothetical protein
VAARVLRPLRPGLFVLWTLLASGCAIPIIGAPARPQDLDREAGARMAATRGGERAGRKPGLTLGTASPRLPRSADACYRALRSRGVAFQRVPAARARGVKMPTRLTGPIDGVEVRARGRKRVHAILDCRLALALHSWAPTLRAAGVTRLEHYSMYRPGARVGSNGKVSGHARGLAIDAARLYLQDGAVIDVLKDWEDRSRGDAPCPHRPDEARPSRILRSVVCDAVDRRLFQVVLTPHHDRAHENHVHLELKPEVGWTYVR